jgi:hypothetical protein
MIAMPYIVVDMVLDILSLIFFCVTSAALLSRYPLANLYLPARLRNQRTLAFVAQGLVLSALSIVVVLVVARLRNRSIFWPFMGDLFSFLGLINSLVLAYQFLDKRYFLNMPKVQRQLLLAIVSVAMTFVPFIVVVTAVVGLFVIR